MGASCEVSSGEMEAATAKGINVQKRTDSIHDSKDGDDHQQYQDFSCAKSKHYDQMVRQDNGSDH